MKLSQMSNVSIASVRCERFSEKSERLFMNATVRGQKREIVVDVGRYEKRPVFMIHDWGNLGNYQSSEMSALLNQTVQAYADIQDALSPAENF